MKFAQQIAHGQGPRNAVKVHIEELVLHGFASADRARIAASVQHELARLIGEGGLPVGQHPLALDRIDGGAFKVKPGAKPQATGAEIARAVFRTLQPKASASARHTRPGLGGRHP